jgi:hypothetical protein
MAISLTSILAAGTLAYSVEREYFNGYTLDHVNIKQVRGESLGSVLAGCIGNKAGYGTDEAAYDIAVATSHAIEKGYEKAFYHARTYEEVRVHLTYQQYDGARYCEVRPTHVGGTLEDMGVGMAFLRILAGRIDKNASMTRALANPTRVVAMLERLGAVRLATTDERQRVLGHKHRVYDLASQEPALTLLTDAQGEAAA